MEAEAAAGPLRDPVGRLIAAAAAWRSRQILAVAQQAIWRAVSCGITAFATLSGIEAIAHSRRIERPIPRPWQPATSALEKRRQAADRPAWARSQLDAAMVNVRFGAV